MTQRGVLLARNTAINAVRWVATGMQVIRNGYYMEVERLRGLLLEAKVGSREASQLMSHAKEMASLHDRLHSSG